MHFLAIIMSYLMGSIPTGVWYSKLVHKVDVRDLGSGNSGATNIGRNFGRKAAIFVTIVDVLKGLVAVVITKTLFPDLDWVIMASGIAAMLGHAYPIFANFRGGKVVATSFAVLAGFNLNVGLMFVALLFLLIFVTSTISLSALTSFWAAAIYVLIQFPTVYGIGFIIIALFMTYRHRANVVRLIKGEESRIKFGLNKPKQ